MKTNKMKIWIGCGIFCILSLFLSSWYALTFNDSRLVVPMNFKDYVFRVKDLPMIISISLTCIYVISLFVMLFVYAGEKQRQVEETGDTGKVNPRWGWLGVLGLLGFAGKITYHADSSVFRFAFFIVMGFFGF